AAAPVGTAGGLTPEIAASGLLLLLKFSLVWIVLVSAAACAFARDGARDGLRVLAVDLSVAYAARGAALVAAMWVWWRSSWWATIAYTVYALGLGDALLLIWALAVAGGFRAGAPVSPEAPRAPAPELDEPLPATT